MSNTRIGAERLAMAWVSLMATALVTGGLALAGMGATLRVTAFDMTGMTDITFALMVMGATLAIAGASSGIAHWRLRRGSGAPADISRGHLRALVGSAATLPVILFLTLTGLITYWRDLSRLAYQYDLLATANGPSALVLVPAAGILLVPGLEAIAGITIAMLCAVVVSLTLTRSAAVLKMTAVGAVLVGGVCVAGWVGVLATERLAPAAETLVRTTAANGQEEARILEMVERHRTVCMRSAQSLSWGWIAVVLIALGTRAVVRPGATPSDVSRSPEALSTDGMDAAAREKALLDGADRLYRNTPPRRF